MPFPRSSFKAMRSWSLEGVTEEGKEWENDFIHRKIIEIVISFFLFLILLKYLIILGALQPAWIKGFLTLKTSFCKWKTSFCKWKTSFCKWKTSLLFNSYVYNFYN